MSHANVSRRDFLKTGGLALLISLVPAGSARAAGAASAPAASPRAGAAAHAGRPACVGEAGYAARLAALFAQARSGRLAR